MRAAQPGIGRVQADVVDLEGAGKPVEQGTVQRVGHDQVVAGAGRLDRGRAGPEQADRNGIDAGAGAHQARGRLVAQRLARLVGGEHPGEGRPEDARVRHAGRRAIGVAPQHLAVGIDDIGAVIIGIVLGQGAEGRIQPAFVQLRLGQAHHGLVPDRVFLDDVGHVVGRGLQRRGDGFGRPAGIDGVGMIRHRRQGRGQQGEHTQQQADTADRTHGDEDFRPDLRPEEGGGHAPCYTTPGLQAGLRAQV